MIRNSYTRCCLILAFFVVGSALFPGSAWSSSRFNMEGIGRWIDGYDLEARGAGWTAIGVSDPSQMSTINPAQLGWVLEPQVHVGIISQNLWVETEDSDGSDRLGSTQIPALHVALPGPGILRWSFALRDMTEGSYEVRAEVNEGREDRFERTITGSGSLTGFSIAAAAVPIKDRLSLGIRYSFTGGTLREEVDEFYDSTVYTDTHNILRTRLENARPLSFGLQGKPIPGLTIGAFYDLSASIDLRSILETTGGSKIDATAESDLPEAYGVGFSFALTSRNRISADWSRRLWGDVDFVLTDGSTTSFTTSSESGFARLEDTERWGIGITRFASTERTAKDAFARRIVWRLGFTHGTLAVPQSNGETVSEWAVTGGIGLPVQFDRGFVDGLIEFGRRGDLDKVGLKETYLRLGFGVTFSKLQKTF